MDEAGRQKNRYVERQVLDVLNERVAQRQPITYGDLTERVTARRFMPNDRALETLLSRLSTQSHKQGLGMISAVVVNKGSKIPGDGFFTLAERLGHSVGHNPKAFHEKELEKVYAASSNEGS